MATPPTRTQYVVPASGNYSSSPASFTTAALTSVSVGDLIVVQASIENAGSTATVTPSASGGSVTWTLRVSQNTGGNTVSAAYCWTGVVGANASNVTITLSRPSSDATLWWGVSATQWTNHGGVGTTFSGNNTTGSGAPSVAGAAACAANSAVQCVINDWNAADGTTRTWRTINGSAESESVYFRNATHHAVYGGYRLDTGAAGTVTQGLTTPSTMRWVLAGVEILGTSGGATNFNGTASLSATDTITAAGAVGAVGAASIAATDAITAAGTVGAVSGASLAATAALTAAGTVATGSGASLAATSTITAAGAVGTSSGASIAATATLTAAGSVTSGASGSAALAATGTITADGVKGLSSGATQGATATITAAGAVGKSSGSSIAATAAVTTAGVVGAVSGASLAATASITAAGVVVSGKSSGATLGATAAINAVGTIATASPASIAATAVISAAGVVGSNGSSTAALQATASITAVGVVTAAPTTRYEFVPSTIKRPISEDPRRFLWNRISYQEGVTVVKTLAGGYRQEFGTHNTNAPDIAAVYLGGHRYIVDEAEAASLTAAGYGANLTELPHA